ncbi:unnamed protein product [Penicillium egyptiacum]|uniref:Uncharacterized protein n=1 Tax=Penicillium egyptiacum TaxID=1303716 RepID=A0A9W4K5W9_9EURO|nr:unnamed protein product [Penicillium egyptiacum]
MSSSMETVSPGSIHSKTSKTSHKHSPNKELKRDNSAIKSAISRGMQQSTSPGPSRLELSPKPSLEQKAANDNVSTKPTNPFELADIPPSDFIFPRDVELGLFDYPSNERETSYEPVSECLPEQRNEVATPYTPALRTVSQYTQRIRGQCGSKCETWLARQMYDELNDISTRIEDIMRGIRVMLEKRGPSDDFEGLGEYHLEAEESYDAFKGGCPEDPLELSDGEDNALFVNADER